MHLGAKKYADSHLTPATGSGLGGDAEASYIGRALRTLSRPLPLLAMVVAAAMLSFYVHLLEEQVLRGDRLRSAQRADPTTPAAAGAARRPTPVRQSVGGGAPSRSLRGS